MADYFIYNHGGSGNHGCEALVRTVSKLFGGDVPIYSESPQQDIRYGLNEIGSLVSAIGPVSKLSVSFWQAYLKLKLHKDYTDMDCLPYLKAIRSIPADGVELSVGGDIYCYEDYRKFIRLHRQIVKRGCKSVLLGCSLSDELFQDPEFVSDMRAYTYISARESLTYEMLKKAGLKNIGLTPDSAFTLETECLSLPEGFQEGNTIGINFSPLVIGKEVVKGAVMENFIRLVRHILDTTDCSVALIPHVVWGGNDDRTALKELYDAINCPERVVLIGDHTFTQLKGFIARCRFFIGARTHATIAAYSSGVPTLVLGYSVKSRGIATDLFGTYENYVLPVQELTQPDDLTNAFCWMQEHEDGICKTLADVMPGYIERAQKLKKMVECSFNMQ